MGGLPLVNPVACSGRLVTCSGRGHGCAWGHTVIGRSEEWSYGGWCRAGVCRLSGVQYETSAACGCRALHGQAGGGACWSTMWLMSAGLRSC